MRFDHRRILATAIAQAARKLKYRPVVFELLPDEFTLTDLQSDCRSDFRTTSCTSRIFAGWSRHGALVEPTGDMATATGGRPAALFRFRREVMQERHAPGIATGACGAEGRRSGKLRRTNRAAPAVSRLTS
jgi:hypothetical protein